MKPLKNTTAMQNAIAKELQTIADRLHELFPESPHIQLTASPVGVEVALHGAGDYDAVTEMMRRIGCGERQKAIFDESGDNPWSVQRGEVDDVRFVGFCEGIPPSCRIETVTETVPEYADTGRTITRTRAVVKCGASV